MSAGNMILKCDELQRRPGMREGSAPTARWNGPTTRWPLIAQEGLRREVQGSILRRCTNVRLDWNHPTRKSDHGRTSPARRPIWSAPGSTSARAAWAPSILTDEVDPKVDALSADNKLIFAPGPLTGTFAPSTGRYDVVTKSPLTGAIAASNSGGSFGPEVKFAGYDCSIFEGKAAKPVYLWIKDDNVEIRDACASVGQDGPRRPRTPSAQRRTTTPRSPASVRPAKTCAACLRHE